MRVGALLVSALLWLAQTAPAQSEMPRLPIPLASIEVSGVVLDEGTGLPLEGVAVMLAGGEIGAITDSAGRYTLRDVPNRNSALIAQRLGYIPEARALWVCTPVLYPDGSCTPVSAADQRVRFFMRSAPPARIR